MFPAPFASRVSGLKSSGLFVHLQGETDWGWRVGDDRAPLVAPLLSFPRGLDEELVCGTLGGGRWWFAGEQYRRGTACGSSVSLSHKTLPSFKGEDSTQCCMLKGRNNIDGNIERKKRQCRGCLIKSNLSPSVMAIKIVLILSISNSTRESLVNSQH